MAKMLRWKGKCKYCPEKGTVKVTSGGYRCTACGRTWMLTSAIAKEKEIERRNEQRSNENASDSEETG